MKPIWERAKYCVRHLTQGWVLEAAGDQLEALFIAGAESERAELTRWRNPKEPPAPGKVVLVKRAPDDLLAYGLGHIDGDGEWIDSWCGSPLYGKIIGWREIHE